MLCGCSQPEIALKGKDATCFVDFQITHCWIKDRISNFLDSKLFIAFHLEIVPVHDQNILKVYAFARAFTWATHRLHQVTFRALWYHTVCYGWYGCIRQDKTSFLVWGRASLFSTILLLYTGIPLLACVARRYTITKHWRLWYGILWLDHRADEGHLVLLHWLYLEPLLALRLLWRIKNVTWGHDTVVLNVHFTVSGNFIFNQSDL